MKRNLIDNSLWLLIAVAALLGVVGSVAAADKKPNILILMTDDTGWGDFGCYGGGANLGHPTPNIDRIAKEGALFWIIRPEVGFGTVRGLSTVLTGAYVQSLPGRGKDRKDFTGLESASPTLLP